MDNNIVKVPLVRKGARARTLYQYDYGMILKLISNDLPLAFEVHFGQQLFGDSVTVIGTADGVAIPDSFFLSAGIFYAWLYLHTGENDGQTVYTVKFSVRKRARPTHETPTPVQQSEIEQVMAALNAAVEAASASANDAEAAYNEIIAAGLVATSDGEGNITISLGGAQSGDN